MVSMKDISNRCDVSITTVSKALNGHTDIGEETRKLIRKTAKEMGYSPNSFARALKTNRSYNVGVLLVDESRSGLTHHYFSAVLESFKATVEKQGYDITFISGSKQRKDKMSYLEHCRGRGLEGVLIACIDYDAPEVVELLQSDLPVVTIDQCFDNKIAIISDNTKGIKDLLSYIIQSGHRKIAYIHGENQLPVTIRRLNGFYETMEQLEMAVPQEYVREAAYRDIETTVRVTNEILDLPDPPTCILFPCDFSSLGGIATIKARGLRIPDDLSVAGYDGISAVRYIPPQLTTISQDTKKLGQYAGEKLIGLIENPKSTLLEHIVVPGHLEKGATIKKIR